MIVGLLYQWAAIVLFALLIGVIPVYFPEIPIYCVVVSILSVLLLFVLFIRQRKQFLLYQYENQALPNEENGCKTCMIVWWLWSCSHGQIASATEKLKSIQTV